MNSIIELRSLLVTAVLSACSLFSFAQYEERIDTALLRKAGFRKTTVYRVSPFDESEGRPGTVSMEITYDSRGRKRSTFSPSPLSSGNLTTFTYDTLGRLLEYKGIFGGLDSNRTTHFYDAAGNDIRHDTYFRGRAGERWYYGYDANRNKLYEVRLSASGDTVSRYDYFYKNNRLDKERYSAHRDFKGEYTYQYDANGHATGKTRTAGTMDLPFPSQEYNAAGELVKEYYYSNENGKKTVVQTRINTWENGRLVQEQIVYPDGKEMLLATSSYYPNGLIREIRSRSGQVNNAYVWEYEYDGNDRPVRKIHKAGGVEQYRNEYDYDANGNLIRERDVLNNAVRTTHTYAYDTQGRRIVSRQFNVATHSYFRDDELPYGGSNDTITETYVYSDTQRVATYQVYSAAGLPAFFYRFGQYEETFHVVPTDKFHRRRQDLYPGTYLDSVQTIRRSVSGSDTLSTYRIGVFSKVPVNGKALRAFITREERLHKGIRTFTDRDSAGRILAEVKHANGTYTIRYLKEFYVRTEKTGILYHCASLYTGDTLRCDVYTHAGRPQSQTYVKGAVPSKTFVYDAAGNVTRMTEQYHSTMIYTTDYVYENGLLVAETRYDDNGGISWKRNYTYAGRKRVKMESEMPGAEHVYRFSYE